MEQCPDRGRSASLCINLLRINCRQINNFEIKTHNDILVHIYNM